MTKQTCKKNYIVSVLGRIEIKKFLLVKKLKESMIWL
jgi:hypothetical protein